MTPPSARGCGARPEVAGKSIRVTVN